MRLTYPFVRVALALLDGGFERQWGYDLSKRSGVRSGVLYPILQRLLDDGWLADGWEDPREIERKRPPRRYYTLTDKGWRELGAALDRARADDRFAVLGELGGGYV